MLRCERPDHVGHSAVCRDESVEGVALCGHGRDQCFKCLRQQELADSEQGLTIVASTVAPY